MRAPGAPTASPRSFKERKQIEYSEEPAMSFVDLISGLGGLLGLFLGLSLMSLFELAEFIAISIAFWLPGRRVHKLNLSEVAV